MINLSDKLIGLYKEEILECELAGIPIKIATKFGWSNPPGINPSDILLTRLVHPKPDETMLFLGCGNGGTSSVMASRVPDGTMWLSDINSIALECAQKTMKLNQFSNATVFHKTSLLPEKQGLFDRAIIVLPKGRRLARRWLVEAFHLLRPNGLLNLVGANEDGIQSVSKDASALFNSPGTVIGYKKRHRCMLFVKNTCLESPDWAQEDGIAPGSWYHFPLAWHEKILHIYSLPGVFSYDHLDDGTDFLLQNLKVNPEERILDVGCGYGIIGLAAYLAAPGNHSQVDLVDSSLLAISSAQKTISENIPEQEQNAFTLTLGNLMQNLKNDHYSLVLTNPPFHTGKDVNYAVTLALIQEALRVLVAEGRFILVANRFIRYDIEMKRYFSDVSILASNNRYHIITATKGG